MVVVWGLNGAVQSVGWPSVTNVFLSWFPDPAARGAWYSLLSTCQNAGAALVPLLVSASVSAYGWRAALYAPALASVCVAVLLGVCLYGSPDAAAKREKTTKAKPSPQDLAQTMRQQVFLNPALWLMAASYFGCSMVRTCLQDWTSLYLHEAKALPIATAARCLFLWELGGFVGTFAAGAISDKVCMRRDAYTPSPSPTRPLSRLSASLASRPLTPLHNPPLALTSSPLHPLSVHRSLAAGEAPSSASAAPSSRRPSSF